MENEKRIVAQNIVNCRKSAAITQAELAEKLNYSDKAVSKWERGEAVPDVFVLKKIADLFNVTVDFMLTEHSEKEIVVKPKKVDLKKRRNMISLLCSALVWFVATIVLVALLLIPVEIPHLGLVYIWAIPVTCIVQIVFSCLWYSKFRIALVTSVFIWSTFMAICLSVTYYRIWVLLLIAVPLQVIVILWFTYMHIKEQAKKKEKENLIAINNDSISKK